MLLLENGQLWGESHNSTSCWVSTHHHGVDYCLITVCLKVFYYYLLTIYLKKKKAPTWLTKV